MGISISEKRNLWPKIKLCNVSLHDENVIQSVLKKNDWLNNMISAPDDFKLVTMVKARYEEERHCIIRCSPEIRKAIYDKGDLLYTLFGRNKIYSTYSIYQCFRCQEFGHSAKNCSHDQICAYCGGDHKTRECRENDAYCTNCAKTRDLDPYHRANDAIKCPIYREEVARIRNRTDHGF